MIRPNAVMVAIVIWTALGGCQAQQSADLTPAEVVPNVVTDDIRAGIEKHIDEQARLGQGCFHLSFEDKQKMVEVMKYLIGIR